MLPCTPQVIVVRVRNRKPCGLTRSPPPAPAPGRRTFTAGATVTLLAGAHQAHVQAVNGAQLVVAQGRTAAMLVELATNALHYEGLEFGTVHLDLTPKKVTLRVERVCQPLHLAEPPGNA